MILPTWPRELLLCLHSQVFFLLVNEWEWAKAVQKFSSALQPFNVIQLKVFCSCSATHDTPSDQLVYLFLACLLAVHPAIQTGTIGTFLHVRSHILLFFMYKIAQISGIKNTQSPHNSLICSDEGIGRETYVTGQTYIRLKFLTSVDSQFPLFPSPDSWIIRTRRQRKLRFNLG